MSMAVSNSMLCDPLMEGGMISTWYTSPVTFVAGRDAFRTTIDWSSLFHEMGHNVTLNFPKTFRFGGRIDGNANALFSETMAQIFQHAAVFETVNGYKEYGLSADIALEIAYAAAISYGMNEDLRPRFKDLNFPISNETYGRLMGIVGTRRSTTPSIQDIPFSAEQTKASIGRTKAKTIGLYTLTGRKCDDLLYHCEANRLMHFKGKMPPGTYLLSLISGKCRVKIVVP
jgi:hypothetical protein